MYRHGARVLLLLVAGALYVLLVGALEYFAALERSGAIADLSGRIVAVTPPSDPWLLYLAMAALGATVMALVLRNQRTTPLPVIAFIAGGIAVVITGAMRAGPGEVDLSAQSSAVEAALAHGSGSMAVYLTLGAVLAVGLTSGAARTSGAQTDALPTAMEKGQSS